MRRTSTWLLAAAVAALGLAAGVDAFRGGGDAPPQATQPVTETEPRPATTEAEPQAEVRTPLEVAGETLRRADLRGRLVYADDSCAVHVLRLPDLVELEAPRGRACTFTNQADGTVGPEGTARSGDGLAQARCEGGVVVVRRPGPGAVTSYPGCAPAWRPDGTLTVVRAGEVVALATASRDGGEPGEEVILSREDLRRELGRTWEGYRFAVQEIAWLPSGRLATIVRGRSAGDPLELLAIFSGRRIVSPPVEGYADLERLRPSPRGTFVAAKIVAPGGITAVDANGASARPALRHGHALAWSPDERWVAMAAADGVYVFRAGERTLSFYHVPIEAQDLLWR